jgi:hypothetical protein
MKRSEISPANGKELPIIYGKRFHNRSTFVSMRNHYRKYTVSSYFPIIRKSLHTRQVAPPIEQPNQISTDLFLLYSIIKSDTYEAVQVWSTY